MGWPPISDIRIPVLGLVRRMVFATPSMMSFFTWLPGSGDHGNGPRSLAYRKMEVWSSLKVRMG